MTPAIKNPYPLNRLPFFTAIVVFVFLIFIYPSFKTELIDTDNAKNAQCAVEMLERKDLIVPTFNGSLRADKPVLIYYFIAFAYKLFGIHALSARLFSLVSGLFTILLTCWITKKYLGLTSAIIAAALLLSSQTLTYVSLAAIPEPYLIFFVTASLICFLLAYERRSRHLLYGFYVFISLAVLVKGPIGLILPVVSAALFLILKKESWHSLKWFCSARGLLIFLILVMPWHIAVSLKTNGEWPKVFFITHNWHRYFNVFHGEKNTLWVTLKFMAFTFFPFSILAIPSFFSAWKKRANHLVLLAFASGLAMLVFWLFSKTMNLHYVIVMLPWLTILTASWLADFLEKNVSRIQHTIFILCFLVLEYVSVRTPFWVFRELSEWGYFTSAETFGLSIAIAFLPAATGLGLFFTIKGKYKLAMQSMAAFWMIMNMIDFSYFVPTVAQRAPLNYFLPEISTGVPLAAYKDFNAAFLFRFKNKISVYYDMDSLRDFLSKNETAYVISHKSQMKELGKIETLGIIKERKEIFARGMISVLLKQKQRDTAPAG